MKTAFGVLLADDHQIVIDGLRSVLTGTEYQVVDEARNGQQALEKILAGPDKYDILITDISMPILNGAELCAKIKQIFPHIKVLVLSMYSSSPVVREAVLAEADGFMLKNSGKQELLVALHKIVNDGTHYSEELIPIIYQQIQKEQKQKENTVILSDREREVLQLIVKEYTSEQIAEKLFISKRTVDNHRINMLEKTSCRSTIGLVKYALKNGIE